MTASQTIEPGTVAPGGTVDPAEVARFSALANEWWDPRGKLAPLHRLNPVRLQFIKDACCRRFARDPKDSRALAGLSILDVGCGGGILSEPLARLGARVTGLDPAEENVSVARLHAARGGLAIDYRATTAEAVAAGGERFDVVLAMEVVEHVADVPAFIAACAEMVKPGGLFVSATINRTPKAFLLAIVGAEYVLRWLPRGTHSYDKLVRPSELSAAVSDAGLVVQETIGVVYDPLADRWQTGKDTDVNYMLLAGRG
jgi:2-polyprenyl-6-hydroxyphenyl methylase/3-demethylubiquinone-9 3-methyltransferase